MGATPGQYVNLSVLPKLPIAAALTQGTEMSDGTSVVVQVTGTVCEIGQRLPYSQLAASYAGKSDFANDARSLITVNMVESIDKVAIGDTFAGATAYWAVTGTGTYRTSAGGADGTGTAKIGAYHLRSWRAAMLRNGIQTLPGDLYCLVAAPGMLDSLKSSSEYFEQAARLGYSDLFKGATVMAAYGWLLIEEIGDHPSTTYSATAGTPGTSLAFGAGAVVGDTNIGIGARIVEYSDTTFEAGRCSAAAWLAQYCFARVSDVANKNRIWRIYSLGD